jgi:ABC-2 type transport system permease protein
MGIGQALTMPMFFASNAIYPIEIMPGWLKAVSRGNPLTYMINAMRALMIRGTDYHGLAADYGILLAVSTAAVLIGGLLYRRVIV